MVGETKAARKMGLWEVIAIGVGGMVGGGIFAVLGLAVQLAHGGTPVAFALAGVVALLTAYSYTKLSLAYPGRGGTVAFLDRAFGPGFLTGSLNVLLWLSYIVMLSLYAFAFGSYAATFLAPSAQVLGKHVLISVVVLAITGLNLFSANIIGEAESWIVGLKVTILLLFVAVGFAGIDGRQLSPGTWAPPMQLLAGGMIIFLAYEGFELIANTAQDVENPQNTLPLAYYSAVTFVIVLYVLVALVAVGNLPVERIVQAKDYALAEAARPSMGQTGFTLIAVAAMLSTASAINATLYGTARISYTIAKDGELPTQLEKKVWNEPVEGLLITALLTLVIANWFDLSRISIMGSAGFLLIFTAVNAANALQAKRTKSHPWISGAGVLACMGALAALLWQTLAVSPEQVWVLVGMVGAAVTIEGGYRGLKKRTIRLHHL
jgi:amino acid transporter